MVIVIICHRIQRRSMSGDPRRPAFSFASSIWCSRREGLAPAWLIDRVHAVYNASQMVIDRLTCHSEGGENPLPSFRGQRQEQGRFFAHLRPAQNEPSFRAPSCLVLSESRFKLPKFRFFLPFELGLLAGGRNDPINRQKLAATVRPVGSSRR